MSDIAGSSAAIQGTWDTQFEGVKDTFQLQLDRGEDIGASCCVFVDGQPVVDVWGGVRHKQTGEPWEQDTMVVVHSATKGLAAMTLAHDHSRGLLEGEVSVTT